MPPSPAPTTTRIEYDGSRPRPPLAGSLAFLLLSFPLGIFWFVLLVTLISVGVGTAIVWVGLAVAAFAVLLWRGGAHVERARVYALLDAYIAVPYRSLPEGRQRAKWRARLSDSATWRDLGYLLLLFPIGIAEFVLVITAWSVSLALIGLPIYYRFLPSGAYHFPSYDQAHRWITVDSTFEALPFAALGVLALLGTVALTKALGGVHARFARVMLGPIRHETVAG